MKEIRLLTRYIRIFSMGILILTLGIFLYLHNPGMFDFPGKAYEEWTLKDPAAAYASGVMSEEVRYGYLLTTETPVWIGPSADLEELRFSGNHLKCSNCHLQAGTEGGAASWVGVTKRYPQFRARENKEGTIENRINGCMERSMNGIKLPDDSREMQAFVAYMEWLGEDLPREKVEFFCGFTPLNIPARAVDLVHGGEVYRQECAICHGDRGEGVKISGAEAYQYPPLWGEDSYNQGAGMHRVLTAAAFIKGNMPFGIASRENPKLTDEEAFDVAGYINSFNRPDKEGLENDFPNRKLKPVSTPYGPWDDEFAAAKHKFGPFLPIVEYYRDHYQITKTK